MISDGETMNKRMTLVEKLEKELAKNCRLNNWDLGFKAAINIVKGYKCTWKGVYNHSQESTHYTLSCGNEYFDNYMGEDVDIFKYCPYCGGEIEFSEV